MLDKVGFTMTPVGASENEPRPKDLREAASQFEALLLGQMLKSVRDSAGDFPGSRSDEASASLLEMADGCFARLIASHGGLGLGNLVIDQLEPTEKPGKI